MEKAPRRLKTLLDGPPARQRNPNRQKAPSGDDGRASSIEQTSISDILGDDERYTSVRRGIKAELQETKTH